MDEDDFGWSDGKEQQIDAKRTLRAKLCPKWQSVASSPEAAATHERIFGKRTELPKSGRTLKRAPRAEDEAKNNYRDNFDRIFRAKGARDDHDSNGKENG